MEELGCLRPDPSRDDISSLLAKNTADDVILLNDSTNQYNVYNKLYWHEDAADTINFAAAGDTTGKISFSLNPGTDEPNLGFTKSSF